jgi:hypothetical protein
MKMKKKKTETQKERKIIISQPREKEGQINVFANSCAINQIDIYQQTN